MPELPEVENVRRSLATLVPGRTIEAVQILSEGVFLTGGLDPSGWIIDSIERRGKYLILQLRRSEGTAREGRLIVHLRMTGRLLLHEVEAAWPKHTHVAMRLHLDGASDIWLTYHDPRRFGRLWLVSDGNMPAPRGLSELGIEPLTPACDATYLAEVARRRPHVRLKALLLDQRVLAGLGNIYADESLFLAGLHPAREAGGLRPREIARLCQAIRDVLEKAVSNGGTTLRDYTDGWNRQGAFQEQLMVYGRAGLACKTCGNTISSGKLAGRTTCWCPRCQRLPRRAGNGPSTIRSA